MSWTAYWIAEAHTILAHAFQDWSNFRDHALDESLIVEKLSTHHCVFEEGVLGIETIGIETKEINACPSVNTTVTGNRGRCAGPRGLSFAQQDGSLSRFDGC
jgi:hypothetical protein